MFPRFRNSGNMEVDSLNFGRTTKSKTRCMWRALRSRQTSSIVVVRAHRGSEGFLFRLMALIREQLKLGAPGALSFLATDPRDLLLFRGTRSSYLRLDFVEQDSSSQKTIECLRALSL